jgi:phospholipid/cholesterol/gamma-HCH transport system ATP-binding protein
VSETVISVHGLVNAFGPQRVHDGLSLEVQRGEVLGIVGGSGSGKSVLLHSMLGLRRPQAGEIRILGHDPDWFQQRPQRAFGVMFQGGALFSGLTVRQNVELPLALYARTSRELRRELAEVKVRLAGLPTSALEKRPAELSGGMVKRAALARALALDPAILFLDEPTAGLDPIAATAFDRLVDHLRQSLDLTVVLITHDVDTLASICDRIAVLVEGRARVGTLAGFMDDDTPWIRDYFHDPRMQRAYRREEGR